MPKITVHMVFGSFHFLNHIDRKMKQIIVEYKILKKIMMHFLLSRRFLGLMDCLFLSSFLIAKMKPLNLKNNPIKMSILIHMEAKIGQKERSERNIKKKFQIYL